MNGDICVNGGAFVNGNGNVDAFRARLFPDLMILFQNRHAFRRNLDAETRDGSGGEKVIGGLARLQGGLGEGQEAEKHCKCKCLFHFNDLDGNDPEFADGTRARMKAAIFEDYTGNSLKASTEL